MKKLLLFLVLFPLGAMGQVFYQFNQPFPNATVRVCPVPSGGNPCPSPSTIFQDSGFTQAITQPVTLGPDGNFGFWTSAGQYTIQIDKPYNLTYVISLGGGGGGGGGSGTVGAGTGGQLATYPANGTTVSGESQVTLAQGGLGVSAASVSAHNYFGNNTGVAAGGAFVQPACGDLSNAGGGCSMSTSAGGDLAGTLPSPTVVATHLSAPLPVAQGGSGAASLTAHGVMIAEGSSAFTALTPAIDSFPLWTNAAADPTVAPIPNCTDTGGNHLNYNTSTHVLSCGTTASSGTVNASSQFSVAYYSATGSSNVISGITGPTTPNGVPEFFVSVPSGGAATLPGFSLAGVPINAQVGTTYTVAANDRASVITANNAAASTYTATNPTTAGFGSNFPYVINNIGAGTVTESATGFTLNGGASLIIPQSWAAFHWSDNTNYRVAILPTQSAFPNCSGGSSALQFTSATGVLGCGTISGTPLTVQTNTVNNTSQSTLNLLNSAAFNGLTLTVTNTSAGNVQLGVSGTLGNGGLANSSTTVNGQTCTLGSSCTVSGAENTQTASYTLTAADLGRLVVMNCSAACTVTLFGSPSNGYYGAIESIGSTVATVSLNTKNYNGAASVPVLESFRPMFFWSDGTNYFGDATLASGAGIAFTPATNGLSIALATALPNGETATTQASQSNDTKVATDAYVDSKVVNTVVDTSTPITVTTTLSAEFHFNENATPATAVTYNLPTAAAGKQFCFSNATNSTPAADTGVLTISTSATGQFIIFTDGTLSATGGNVTSGGAAADAACVVGVDSTHWALYVQRGTWTKH